MSKAEKFPLEQVLAAIKDSGGIQAVVAQRLKCSRNTVSRYAREYATVRQALDDESETVLDLAESKLIAAIRNDDLSAVKYILSTKGKGRGYSERQEVTGKDGGPIKAAVVIEWPEDEGAGD